VHFDVQQDASLLRIVYFDRESSRRVGGKSHRFCFVGRKAQVDVIAMQMDVVRAIR